MIMIAIAIDKTRVVTDLRYVLGSAIRDRRTVDRALGPWTADRTLRP